MLNRQLCCNGSGSLKPQNPKPKALNPKSLSPEPKLCGSRASLELLKASCRELLLVGPQDPTVDDVYIYIYTYLFIYLIICLFIYSALPIMRNIP